METVPRQVHQDGHWMTMGLGIKRLKTVKGEPKTLTGRMLPQELCANLPAGAGEAPGASVNSRVP